MVKHLISIFLFLVNALFSLKGQYFPSRDLGDLFREVQMKPVFEDSKTFPDCIPLMHPVEIFREYHQQKDDTLFDLEKFVMDHFELPPVYNQEFKTDTTLSITEHIEELWSILSRDPDTAAGSLVPLPYPYVVPGGRFREIYYWDSYFTMLGLAESGKNKMIRDMIDNFSFLIDTFGFIPNGNRTYYLSRSQPPFYALMVELLVDLENKEIWRKYLPYIEKEYQFWMRGKDQLTPKDDAYQRVVLLDDGYVLNRYWDGKPAPRPEAYKEDFQLMKESGREPGDIYRDIRAACESGWDFSSRWLKDELSLETIHTTEIIPVDLNALLYKVENILARGYGELDSVNQHQHYLSLANKRKEAINRYCWNEEAGFYMDYDFKEGQPTSIYSLAGMYPLFVKLATPIQAGKVSARVKKYFLFEGGVSTTLTLTSQQWDGPNGWPPLQWITIQGMKNYQYEFLAKKIAENWTSLNQKIFKSTGKMMEKYNVVCTDKKAGGGEYPLQDGFGWTNGIYLKLTPNDQ